MKKVNKTMPEATEIMASLDEIKKYAKLTAIVSKSMLTTEEVCLFMGLKTTHLYKLTSKRQIPFYKPNGKVLYFKRVEVEEWMSKNRQQTEEETEQEAIIRLAKMKRKK